MPYRLEQEIKRIEQARTEHQRGLVKLHRNGQPLYAPEEMERRRRELEVGYTRTFQEITQAAEEAAAEARATLEQLASSDWLPRLSADDLERMNQLRPSLDEDWEREAPATMVQRVRDALEHEDQAMIAAHLRAIRAAELPFSQEQQELKPLIAEMEGKLHGATFSKRRERAEQQQKDAQRVMTRLVMVGRRTTAQAT